MNARIACFALILLFGLLVARRATAQPAATIDGLAGEAPLEAPADTVEPRARGVEHWWYPELGVRTVVVKDRGFDPYANTDLLGQFVLALSCQPLRFDWLALGLVAEYDVGSRQEHVRGNESSLTAHRLSVGVLADVEIVRHLHLFARLAPAGNYLHGTIEDSGSERPLVADGWTWGMDLSGGVAVLFGTFGGKRGDDVGIWARAEFGYSFAGEVDMAFGPEEDDEDPRQFGTVSLPPLSPRGLTNRFTVGVSF